MLSLLVLLTVLKCKEGKAFFRLQQPHRQTWEAKVLREGVL
jgi:hypothetical protein